MGAYDLRVAMPRIARVVPDVKSNVNTSLQQPQILPHQEDVNGTGVESTSHPSGTRYLN